nr:rifin PIR protein,putative [Plasmodium sp. DRC-Itaito]
MKVHYINILLFAHELNILVNTHKKNTSITKRHTHTNRSLCECEIYAPANYDNYPEMKSVMDNFNRQTSERLRDYDDRMIQKRKQCKERCDKESQKIILKDKLEKELMDKFATLDKDIQSDAIPTCVCEKSMADKVEKGCLRCGGILGAAMPELGAIGGTALYALNTWKDAAIVTATAAAEEFGATVGKILGDALGKKIVIGGLEALDLKILGILKFDSFFSEGFNIDVANAAKFIAGKRQEMCGASGKTLGDAVCKNIDIKLGSLKPNGITRGPPPEYAVRERLNDFLDKATRSAAEFTETTTEEVASSLTTKETALIEAGFNSTTTSIYAAIIAIVVIVLIMVIIYLILRRRRKKKMKKKLQYIKLLEE